MGYSPHRERIGIVKERTKKEQTKETPAKNKRAVGTKKSMGTSFDAPVKIQPLKKPRAAKKPVEQPIKPTKTAKAKKTPKIEETAVLDKSKPSKKAVKIIFLGGVGEIGKNMTAIEYGNDIIIIDAGMTFPSEDMPGIDSVVPDISYLTQNKHKIRGVFLTHGHEDHIGGLPYLLKELDEGTPIFATRLTLMLADNKFQEHHITRVDERVVKPGDCITVKSFKVEFINVNHSISGACALAIYTPCGIIYHSGDYKIDLTPVAGEPIDLKRIAELGQEGVLLYMAESTNIERAGYTLSETVVGTTFDHLFAENSSRRLIIATFASNVHRLQQIIDMAVKYRRKVALSGRSMLKVVEAAARIGELKLPDGILIDVERIKNFRDNELVIISTGSQGEPMSALTRMASGDFNKVTIGENDTIIISATPIPGNEKMVYRVINNLYKQGAKVVYESLEKIHVSGHACQEEHKMLHTLLKPKFFIPVHGEYRHLKRHAALAESLGMPARNILITEVGNCVELTPKSMKLGENVQAGTRLIDGEGVEEYGTSEVMKDRIRMSTEGVFVISLAVTGNYVVGEPEIDARGYVFTETTGTLQDVRDIVRRAVDGYNYERGNKAELIACVKKAVRSYFYKRTKKSPLLMVSVLDV